MSKIPYEASKEKTRNSTAQEKWLLPWVLSVVVNTFVFWMYIFYVFDFMRVFNGFVSTQPILTFIDSLPSGNMSGVTFSPVLVFTIAEIALFAVLLYFSSGRKKYRHRLAEYPLYLVIIYILLFIAGVFLVRFELFYQLSVALAFLFVVSVSTLMSFCRLDNFIFEKPNR